MPRIPRHPVSIEGVRKRVRYLAEDLPEAVVAARRDLVHCDTLKIEALEYAAQVLVLTPDAPEACRALRVGAEAITALFEGAQATGKSVEVRLGDGPPVMVPSSVDQSLHNVGDWTDGFCMAVLCREKDLLESLCRIPTDLLRRSTSRGLEHAYLFVDALRAYWRKGDARRHALAALEATRDPQLPEPTVEAARELAGPTLEVLLSLLDGRDQPFNESLSRALEHHRVYWGGEDRLSDPVGYFSLKLTALAALAHDAGIPVTASSDYLPMGIVNGDCSPRA